jgi:CHAT domain-containing protein/Tfp pilus assembly protein PilF
LNSALDYFYTDSSRFTIKIAQCYLSLGSCLKSQRLSKQSEEHILKAIKIFEASQTPRYYDLGRAYNNLGTVYNDLFADYKKAQASYLKALNIKSRFGTDSLSLAITQSNLGNFYKMKGNFLKSLDHYQKSVALSNENKPRDAEQFPTFVNNYASILIELGQFENAAAYYTKSINYIINREGPSSPKLIDAYLNLGGCYLHEKNIEGLEHLLLQTLNVLTENFTPNDIHYATYYRLNGNLRAGQNKYDEAFELFTKAHSIFSENLSENSIDAILTLQNISDIEIKRNNYRQAINSLRKSAQILIQQFGIDNPLVLSAFNSIGFCHLSLLEIDSSITYFHRSINSNIVKANLTPVLKSADRIIDKTAMVESYYYLSKCYQKKFRMSGHVDDLLVAAKFVDLGNDLIESTRRGFESATDQIAFNEKVGIFFEQAVEVYFQLYQKSPDKKFLNAAFMNFELAKAQSLEQSLKKLKLSTFAGVSLSLIEKETALTDRIRQLNNQLVQQLSHGDNSNQDLLNEYNTDYQEARENYTRLTDSIKENLPNYYQFKYEKNLVSVDDIQKEIIRGNKDIALIEFLYGDSSMYCQVVMPGKSELLKFGNPESIRNHIVALRNQVKYKMESEMYSNAFELYRELFYPVDSLFRAEHLNITHLIIVPDNILNYLPFEILVTNPVKPKEKPHFLLSDYGISYAYSSTLLWQKSTDVSLAAKPNHSFVGFAPLFLTAQSNGNTDKTEVTRDENSDAYFQSFQPLKRNVEEVSQISRSFKKQKDKNLVLEGNDASASYLFKQNMAEFSYIHFATHGFVDMDKPQNSGIAFTRNSGSRNPADGILFTSDVYKLRLKAELVCISSCESGLGKFYKGEGIVGLSRAFLYAGARNLTVSLWKVDDLATSQLMIQYYKEIEKGNALSQALTQAKRKMLASSQFHHPYYWASFILIGQ